MQTTELAFKNKPAGEVGMLTWMELPEGKLPLSLYRILTALAKASNVTTTELREQTNTYQARLYDTMRSRGRMHLCTSDEGKSTHRDLREPITIASEDAACPLNEGAKDPEACFTSVQERECEKYGERRI